MKTSSKALHDEDWGQRLSRLYRTSAASLKRWPRLIDKLLDGALLQRKARVAPRLRRTSRAAERLTISAAPPLVPDFPGPRLWLDVEELGLGTATRERLLEAGITNTAELARSPDERIHRLLGAGEVERLRTLLQDLAAAQPVPGTLAQWARDLLAPKKNRTIAERRIRVLVGADPLPDDAADEARPGARKVQQVAEAFGIDPAMAHGSLQVMRRKWNGVACRAELNAALHEVIEDLGQLCTLEEAARELARRRAGGEEPGAEQTALAVALVRVAAELRPAEIYWRRLKGGGAWVAVQESQLDALWTLAAAADHLAATEPLPSSEKVREYLEAMATPTSLAALPPDRLVTLAAKASVTAAASARLELYPRGLAAERALDLSRGVLTPPGLTPEEVRRRVAARYPEAAPLPGRPELDALLARHDLTYDEQLGEYLLPGVAHASTAGTLKPLTRLSSALPHQRLNRSPRALEAQAFQDALDRGVERGRFRVVQVEAPRAEEAAVLLAKELDTEAVSVDHRLWAAVERKGTELGVDPEKIVAADRAGPEGSEWHLLVELVRRAAAEEVEALLADRQRPRLLVHPGILARYGLAAELQELATRGQHEDGAAVVLLVPSHADGLAPSINNRLPVPTESTWQRLLMPESWIRNEHRSAEPLN